MKTRTDIKERGGNVSCDSLSVEGDSLICPRILFKACFIFISTATYNLW
jgi:hypothetical protein